MKGFPKKLYKEGEQHNGKHEQERFSPENLVEIARSAKSVEELLALAKENNFEMNEEEAKTYFAQLNPTSGELDDDDLDNVAGGGCGKDSKTSTKATVFASSSSVLIVARKIPRERLRWEVMHTRRFPYWCKSIAAVRV